MTDHQPTVTIAERMLQEMVLPPLTPEQRDQLSMLMNAYLEDAISLKELYEVPVKERLRFTDWNHRTSTLKYISVPGRFAEVMRFILKLVLGDNLEQLSDAIESLPPDVQLSILEATTRKISTGVEPLIKEALEEDMDHLREQVQLSRQPGSATVE